jgi:hypothetical protein
MDFGSGVRSWICSLCCEFECWVKLQWEWQDQFRRIGRANPSIILLVTLYGDGELLVRLCWDTIAVENNAIYPLTPDLQPPCPVS